MTTTPEGIRLQKALAQAGIASRRVSEELIAAGRVEVCLLYTSDAADE